MSISADVELDQDKIVQFDVIIRGYHGRGESDTRTVSHVYLHVYSKSAGGDHPRVLTLEKLSGDRSDLELSSVLQV